MTTKYGQKKGTHQTMLREKIKKTEKKKVLALFTNPSAKENNERSH